VLYNHPRLAPDHPNSVSESDVLAAAKAVVAALASRGFKAWLMAARPPVARLVRSLTRQKPDIVFNLIEGFGGHSGGEAWVTSLLEMMGLPYTGCPPEAQCLCRHKGRAKALLLGHGLPTAAFWAVKPGDPLPSQSGQLIVKPEAEDASLGIDQGSVVADPTALAERVETVRRAYGPVVLVESYLPGSEYNVGVLGLPEPLALPIAEVVFRPRPGDWPILTYAAKWSVGSNEDLASPVRCPAEITQELSDRLGALAISAFEATGCRDYARVDFRMDATGSPMILEVNPNPDVGPMAGWARALEASGRDYSATLAGLARQALDRGAQARHVPD
jgi:D-alanine-D-alanine ligase